jgi:hypothetical protein
MKSAFVASGYFSRIASNFSRASSRAVLSCVFLRVRKIKVGRELL